MSKNSSSSVGKQHKLLLKVLNCVWSQFVSRRANSVSIFCANPSLDTYNNAVQEVVAIANIININAGVLSLTSTNLNAFAAILVATANGVVAIDSTYGLVDPTDFNTYSEFLVRERSNSPNLATQKTIQLLNTNENLPVAVQLKPALTINPANIISDDNANAWVVQASTVERTGCAGVANTGFVGLIIEADIERFPFDTCENLSLNCVERKYSDRKNRH